MVLNKTCLILLVAVVFISYIQTGSALECYTCSSLDNSTCGTPFNPAIVGVMKCMGNDNVCLKGSNHGTTVAVVTRGCGTKDSCHAYNKKCHTCNSDRCNSSNNAKFQFMLLPLVGITIVKSYL
ncbi:uncharacterized protein LOC116178726 [Photinus pyralis]|uniref:uncharacterized protein LOC116178726 n=1 Tax=Photinus pyralis TaxID=7054 RepID=UPI0012670FA0|nr:uncharacterized protein LOC116178726 [Photinus pyralis]